MRRAVESLRATGLEPIVGPELEFFLLRLDPAAEHGVRRRVDQPSMVYTVGPQADPGGIVRATIDGLAALGLRVLAFNHEFMNSQYEVNLCHTDALLAADWAFRLKAAVKDVAAQHGLVATFMGKPFNDQGSSGTHLHVSLNRDELNAFDAPGEEDGGSAELRAFSAGVLAHAAALMALLNPTINAYRRIQPDSLAPTHANWGPDNRGTFIRIPPERGAAARIEIRVADGAANPYLAIAAILTAGRARLNRACVRRRPSTVMRPGQTRADRPGTSRIAGRCPRCARGRRSMCRALGPEIVETFVAVKRFEIERHRAWVSDWEIAEYLHHL